MTRDHLRDSLNHFRDGGFPASTFLARDWITIHVMLTNQNQLVILKMFLAVGLPAGEL